MSVKAAYKSLKLRSSEWCNVVGLILAGICLYICFEHKTNSQIYVLTKSS